MSEAEPETKVEENGKLRLLEQEYWNVVDGGVEEMEVRTKIVVQVTGDGKGQGGAGVTNSI